MHAFLISTGIVALAEIGDKTQLLALLLAAKFRRPWPIVAGILAATAVNHAGAGLVGRWAKTFFSSWAGPDLIRWGLAFGFIAMAFWTLIPDKIGDDEADAGLRKYGAFLTTLVAFFLVEMGDKTQIATVALAARFPDLVAVVAGTTVGMMLANVPVVFCGDKIAARLPLKYVRWTAAACFALLGVSLIAGFGFGPGLAD